MKTEIKIRVSAANAGRYIDALLDSSPITVTVRGYRFKAYVRSVLVKSPVSGRVVYTVTLLYAGKKRKLR